MTTAPALKLEYTVLALLPVADNSAFIFELVASDMLVALRKGQAYIFEESNGKTFSLAQGIIGPLRIVSLESLDEIELEIDLAGGLSERVVNGAGHSQLVNQMLQLLHPFDDLLRLGLGQNEPP